MSEEEDDQDSHHSSNTEESGPRRNISRTIPAPCIPEELEEESPPHQGSLPLEIMSSSSRRGAAPAIFGHEEEHELNFTHCERNPTGMFAFLTPNVTLQSQEVVDVVSVCMAVADPRDVMEIKGELLNDGSGTLVSQPSVPSCFVKNVKEMHALENKEFFAKALARDHHVQAPGQYHRQKWGPPNPPRSGT
jgi:hypothetical protein